MRQFFPFIIKATFGFFLLAVVSCNQANRSDSSENQNEGVIFANPDSVASNISFEKASSIVSYFNQPKNKVRLQLASKESQYAWQHMSSFFTTAQVNRSGKISELPYDIQKSIGEITYQKSDGQTISVNQHFDKNPIDGLVVLKKGTIVYERYRTMRPDDKHIWYSVSKVIGATIMLFLEEEGKVDVNKNVSVYLPELKGTEWDNVKVIEALDMATGLNGTEHDEPNHDSRTNPQQLWFQWAVSIGVLPNITNNATQWYDILGKMKRTKPAYTSFEYNSINTFIVNRIVERIGNKPLTDQFSERIWSKIGMEHDGYMATTPAGMSLGFGFMNSTLRDLARFGMIYTPSQTKIASQAIISEKMLKKMQNTQHSDMYAKAFVGKKLQKSFPDEKGISNRYQWDAVFTDGDMYKAGVGGQGLYVSPSKDIVIAWFCTGSGNNQEETMARSIVNKLK
jgi:CubicO group peptidase (beta-lactamase class C family)